jgi:hypothetical protein
VLGSTCDNCMLIEFNSNNTISEDTSSDKLNTEYLPDVCTSSEMTDGCCRRTEIRFPTKGSDGILYIEPLAV